MFTNNVSIKKKKTLNVFILNFNVLIVAFIYHYHSFGKKLSPFLKYITY